MYFSVIGPIRSMAKLQVNPKPETDEAKFSIPKVLLNFVMDELAIGKKQTPHTVAGTKVPLFCEAFSKGFCCKLYYILRSSIYNCKILFFFSGCFRIIHLFFLFNVWQVSPGINIQTSWLCWILWTGWGYRLCTANIDPVSRELRIMPDIGEWLGLKVALNL